MTLEDQIAKHVAALQARGIEEFRLERFAELYRAGRFSKAWRAVDKPLCGAKTRRGTRCLAQGTGKGNRCKLHGGMSTGAKTPEGKARQAAGRWAKHRAEKLAYILS